MTLERGTKTRGLYLYPDLYGLVLWQNTPPPLLFESAEKSEMGGKKRHRGDGSNGGPFPSLFSRTPVNKQHGVATEA